jgi:hypothetical protein
VVPPPTRPATDRTEPAAPTTPTRREAAPTRREAPPTRRPTAPTTPTEVTATPQPTPSDEAEPDTPTPVRRWRRWRRRIVLTVVILALLGVAGVRVREATATRHYAAVCVDVRTEWRAPIDRCRIDGQDAYHRWYVKAGERVPAVGEPPRAGGLKTPAGRNVRVTEDVDAQGGVFQPAK